MTPEALALKLATAEMVKGAGGVEAAAAFCRVGKSVLSDNQSPNRADSFAAIDVVAALEPLARARDGWPHVTLALCQRMGGTFVAMPDVPPERRDLCRLLTATTTEGAELTSSLLTALADGRCEPREAAVALIEARQLLRAAATMVMALESIAGGE